MWYSAAQTRQINSGLPPEFFFVAPASSFHHHESSAAAATINFDPHSFTPSSAIGVGVIPLLSATPCLAPTADEEAMNNRGGGMRLWQQQGQNAAASSSSMGVATCQDCGNQAKKDCPHRRCRTCCKSRGYDCSTHVKSTWVSAERRRERQLMGAANTGGGSSQSTSSAKKPRLDGVSQTTSHTSTSNNTPPRSFDASSSHQDPGFKESLPGQVRAPAVFKCVRVTAIDDGEDQYAYQAVVNIGGHVFKGFLYDQGADGRDVFPNISELHLGGGKNGALSSPPGLDPSDMYGGSGGGLLGGSAYGNPMN